MILGSGSDVEPGTGALRRKIVRISSRGDERERDTNRLFQPNAPWLTSLTNRETYDHGAEDVYPMDMFAEALHPKTTQHKPELETPEAAPRTKMVAISQHESGCKYDEEANVYSV
jgi:hypothetical protein